MAKRKPSKAKDVGKRQVDGAPPIIEDAKLSRMGEHDVAPKRLGRRIVTMPDDPKPYKGTKNLMDPLPAGRKRSPRSAERERGDQQELPVRRARGKKEQAPGYVRLRIRVERGELSLLGAKFVEGPLVQAQTLRPGLAYEVKVGARRVAVGETLEGSEWRSFPDPLGRPGLERHHVTEAPDYEIAVRVPAENLSIPALANTRVTLYRWEGKGPSAPLQARALSAQLKGDVTSVGVLKNIQLDRLPKKVQRELQKALR